MQNDKITPSGIARVAHRSLSPDSDPDREGKAISRNKNKKRHTLLFTDFIKRNALLFFSNGPVHYSISAWGSQGWVSFVLNVPFNIRLKKKGIQLTNFCNLSFCN